MADACNALRGSHASIQLNPPPAVSLGAPLEAYLQRKRRGEGRRPERSDRASATSTAVLALNRGTKRRWP